MAFPWSIGEVKIVNTGNFYMYVGVNAVVNDNKINNTISTNDWDDVNCTQELCISCREVAAATEIPAIIMLISSLPALTADL
jgi:hypothetical protein